LGNAVGGHEGIRIFAKNLADLVGRPDKELALFSFAATVPEAGSASWVE
jgi:hypothetical protein